MSLISKKQYKQDDYSLVSLNYLIKNKNQLTIKSIIENDKNISS